MPSHGLLRQLGFIGRRLRLAALGRGLLQWLMVVAGLGVLLTAGARWLGSPYLLPAAGALALLAGGACLGPRLRRLPARAVAARLEAQHPELRESVLTAADLALRQPPYHSPALTAAAIGRAEAALPGLPLEPLLGLTQLRRLALWAALSVLLAGSLVVWQRASLARLLQPASEAARPAAPRRAPAAPLPLLSGVRLALEPPAYTGLPRRELDEGFAEVRALRGTRVTVSALAPATGALALSLDGRPASVSALVPGRQGGTFTLQAATTWRLAVAGGESAQALTGRVLPQADAPPVVRLRHPQHDLRLAAPPVAALEVAASDDFGLTGLALEYRVGAGGAWQRQELGAAGRSVRLDYDWDLAPLNLRPGQSVWCRFAARDNDTVSGPHVAYSTTRRFTLADPRPRQAAARVQQAQAAERETLEQLQEEAREIARELEELQERVSSGEVRPGDATARATAEQAAQRQERLGQKVQQAVAEARQQLQEAGALTPEVQQRLSDLNQALRQALEQKLPRVVAQLRKLAQATPNQKWPQDLEAARAAQEELQRQLEQLAALLKQAQLETSLGQLRQDVQKLLARQQALDKERAGAERAELRQQADRQQQLGRDTRDLPARLDQVAAQSREAAPQLEQRLRELSAQTRQADPAGKMDRAAGQLRQGQAADAGQSQAGAMQDLQQLAGQLAGTQADVYARQRQELQQAVGRIMRDALYLSRQQERVLADTEPLAGQTRQETVQAKPQLQRLQQRQEIVTQGLERLQQRLGDLSQQTPLLDPRLVAGARQLTAQAAQAAREVAGGAPTEAAADQREVMAGLNQLVQQFLDSQQSYQQASAQMAWQETLKRLEQMAQQQSSLNQMTQQMGSSGQPQPGPGAGQLADQQAALRQALQQMLGQSGEGSGLGQQLGGVPAQMNDVAQALEGRRVTADTRRTQAQILHKLLDAQRSLYRQDRQDRQRRAEAPKPYRPPASPPQLRASARPSRLTPPAPPPREWPLGYEDLTRRYFEAVGRGETIGR